MRYLELFMKIDTTQLQPALSFKRSGLKSIQVRMGARFSLGLYSTSIQYGLRRDLLTPLEQPKAKIPISVRALTEGDLDQLLPLEEHLHEADEGLDIARRRAFAEKNSQGCFVAVDQRK